MIEYTFLWIILVLLIGIVYWAYKYRNLQNDIKDFNPIIRKEENRIVTIGKVIPFTTEKDDLLSLNKDALKVFLEKLDYRIAQYTSIQNTNYRVNGLIEQERTYTLKSDSEKWMEQGKMSGYMDIRQDLEYLLSKE